MFSEEISEDEDDGVKDAWDVSSEEEPDEKESSPELGKPLAHKE